MPIIDRDGAPAHLFATPELDFSEDLFAEPLKEQWFRLAAMTRGNEADARGVRAVTERQSLLLTPGAFEAIGDKLTSIGNVLSYLGAPGESISALADQAYAYRPFYVFEIMFTDTVGEPIAFIPKVEGERELMLNPDVALYFKLEEKPHGSGLWWDPRRGVEVIRQRVINGGAFELIEMRVDYLLKYLRMRERALVVGHYRHFHFLNPPQAVIDAVVKGEVVLRGSGGAKAIIQSSDLQDGVGRREALLIRRLHLWSQIEPPPMDVETAFDEEPEFDVAAFTLPMREGPVAPGRFARAKLKVGESFAGVSCDFMDRAYFQQEVLTKYQGASGFSVADNGAVHCGSHWGLMRSTYRIGNELLATAIGDFAEGVPYHEWQHWRQFAVPPPSIETMQALEQEPEIPEAVNCVVDELGRLNDAFAAFAVAAGAPQQGKLWYGSLDSLAGRQLKWVYPAAAADAEFLTRATLASTLFIDALDVTSLRRLLNAFGKDLHLDSQSKSLGSRNLLQRVALVAELVARFRPKPHDIADLVAWAQTGAGAAEADLQAELTRTYAELRQEFSPLAFLYDLRLHGGLVHPPSSQSAATAAKNLGLAEKGWRRADYLQLLHRVHCAVEAVLLRVEAAANALA